MSKIILNKVITGLSDQNIRFESLRRLMHALNFQERIKGDHHIFTKDNVMEIINIQPLGNGKAKAYQVKQVRNIILKYSLNKEI
jgi:hypothetical protein